MASTFAYANSTLREQVSLKVSHLVNYSPGAAVTNDRKLGGLKQHKGITHSSVDQKPEVGPSSLSSKCQQDYVPSEGFRGPLSFPGSRSHPHSLAHGPFLLLRASNVASL